MSEELLAKLTEREIMEVDTPICLVGEIGSGKTFVAREIHERRVGKGEKAPPFLRVALNTLGDGDMMRRELFGIGKGMATGVDAGLGVFESAGNGTVFLDEFHLAPLDVQRQLLTLLDERTVRRTGESKARDIEAKLIVATQQPLNALVAAGTIIADLHSRLEAGPELPVPPLRDATDAQFARLVHALAAKLSLGLKVRDELHDRLWRLTQKHGRNAWPNNIRQLEAAMTKARNGRPIEEIERWLEQSWARVRVSIQEVPVGQLQSTMPKDDDRKLLENLLVLSIPAHPDAVTKQSADPDKGRSKGGRPTKVVTCAADIADLLLYEQKTGTLKSALQHLIGSSTMTPTVRSTRTTKPPPACASKSSLEELDRALDAWVGHGILQPARREGQDAFILRWPVVQVCVTIGDGGASHGWNPLQPLGEGEVVRVNVRTRISCRVRIATLEHPVTGDLYDSIDWGEGDGDLIEADGLGYVEWSMPFTLDASAGWEQFIVHLKPELPPSNIRGTSRGLPSARRRGIAMHVVLQARALVAEEWGRGWMTDFIIRKKDREA